MCAIAALDSLLMIITILSGSAYLAVVEGMLLLATFSIYKMWYLIEAKIIEKTNLVQLFNGFELDGSRSAIISRVANGYTSTSAARVDSLGSVAVDRERVERLIEHLNSPFKLVLQVERFDASKLLERLETKRSIKEIELSRVHGPSSGKGLITSNRLKSEISHLEQEIAGIKGGGMPLKLSYYMMTCATAQSRYKAEELSRMQLGELVSEFDATFGTKSSVLSSDSLLKLMKFDSMIA